MSDLSKFVGKAKTVNINGKEIMLKPIGIKDMALLADAESSDKEKQLSSMDAFIRQVLKKTYPDATEEEMDVFCQPDEMEAMIEAIFDVSGMKVPKDAVSP